MANQSPAEESGLWAQSIQFIREVGIAVGASAVGVIDVDGERKSVFVSAPESLKSTVQNRGTPYLLVLLVLIGNGIIGLVDLVGWTGTKEILQSVSYFEVAAAGLTPGALLHVAVTALFAVVLGSVLHIGFRLCAFVLLALLWLADLAGSAGLRLFGCPELMTPALPRDRYHFVLTRVSARKAGRFVRAPKLNYAFYLFFVVASFALFSLRDDATWEVARQLLPDRLQSFVRPEAAGMTAPTVTLCFAGNRCDAVTATSVLESSRFHFVTNLSLPQQCRDPAGFQAEAKGRLEKLLRDDIKAVLPGDSEEQVALCTKLYGKSTELRDIAHSLRAIGGKLPEDKLPSATTFVGMLGGLNANLTSLRESTGSGDRIVDGAGIRSSILAAAGHVARSIDALNELGIERLLSGLRDHGAGIQQKLGRLEASLERVERILGSSERTLGIGLDGIERSLGSRDRAADQLRPIESTLGRIEQVLGDIERSIGGLASVVAGSIRRGQDTDALSTMDTTLGRIEQVLGSIERTVHGLAPKGTGAGGAGQGSGEASTIDATLSRIEQVLGSAETTAGAGMDAIRTRLDRIGDALGKLQSKLDEMMERPAEPSQASLRVTLTRRAGDDPGPPRPLPPEAMSEDAPCSGNGFGDLFVRFAQNSHFLPGDAEWVGTSQERERIAMALRAIGERIRASAKEGVYFQLVGEASAEGPAVFNWTLSHKRAERVCRALEAELRSQGAAAKCGVPLDPSDGLGGTTELPPIRLIATPKGAAHRYRLEDPGLTTKRRVTVMACHPPAAPAAAPSPVSTAPPAGTDRPAGR